MSTCTYHSPIRNGTNQTRFHYLPRKRISRETSPQKRAMNKLRYRHAVWCHSLISCRLTVFGDRLLYLSICFFNTSSPLREIRVTLPAEGTAAARAALPIPISVCSIVRVSKQWCGCPCFGFLTCTRVQMHAMAHWGCTDTVRESALEVDSGRRIPCRTVDSNPESALRLAFQSDALPTEPCPPF